MVPRMFQAKQRWAIFPRSVKQLCGTYQFRRLTARLLHLQRTTWQLRVPLHRTGRKVWFARCAQRGDFLARQVSPLRLLIMVSVCPNSLTSFVPCFGGLRSRQWIAGLVKQCRVEAAELIEVTGWSRAPATGYDFRLHALEP